MPDQTHAASSQTAHPGKDSLTEQDHLIQQLSQGKMGKDFYPECQGAVKERGGVGGGRDAVH